METKQGMLNSNKKECHLENLNFPSFTQLTYSIDLTDRLTFGLKGELFLVQELLLVSSDEL